MVHLFMPTLPKPSCNLLFIVFLSVLVVFSTIRGHDHHRDAIATARNSRAAVFYQNAFLSSGNNYTVESYLRQLTLHPHLAGTPPARQTAHYVKTHFEKLNLPTHVNEYTVLLSYPTHSSLSAYFINGTSRSLSLSEPGSAGHSFVQPYHAYSPSGSAYGPAVFVNYGNDEDYRALGVDVKGCVAIARRGGGLSRNEVVTKAAENGVAAVLMYTEGDSFRDGVERGTVMMGVGDPLTPGWASAGGERLGLEEQVVAERFPKVPSMPISEEMAQAILKSLEGTRVPYGWRDTLKTRIEGAGPGPTILNFTYQGEKRLATISNIFAVIRGSEEADRFVILGNHRDAWTYGAVDPNSGTATLLDIARRYSLLMRLGWNPRRTIILCSWDAEEFGMIGSTEWVEQNLVNLGSKAVAYLNVDCAVQGPGLFAGATPQLDDLLIEVTKKVKDPESEGKKTLYEKWRDMESGINIQRLSGVDSDFAPFLQHGGVPSIDLYYGRAFPVYHTAFDSYNWMANHGDPLFQRHVAVSGVWGLLALQLADDPILPFNYLSYAAELQGYANALSGLLKGSVSLGPLMAAIDELKSAAEKIQEEAKKIKEEEETKSEILVLKKRILNDRLMLAERGFLDSEGLQGRTWFKHLVYGPKGEGGNKMDFFPGIGDAISESRRMGKKVRKEVIEHQIWRVTRAIQRAAYALQGDLILQS